MEFDRSHTDEVQQQYYYQAVFKVNSSDSRWQKNPWKRTVEKEMGKLKMTLREMEKAYDHLVWQGIVSNLCSSRNSKQIVLVMNNFFLIVNFFKINN